MALADALKALGETSMCVAVFDATNTTRSRRQWLVQQLAGAVKASNVVDAGPESMAKGIRLVFLESVCTDDAKVWANVKEAKMHSPDYAGWAQEDAMNDFFARIAKYKRVYEQVSEEEGVSFIRLENMGEKLVMFRTRGYAIGRIVELLSHTRLTLRPIILTRPGETSGGLELGGNRGLSPFGSMYAEKFAETMVNLQKQRLGGPLVVWASGKVAARQFVAPLAKNGIEILQLEALNDLNVGDLDGYSYAEFAEKEPEEYEARLADKWNYKFPKGESYSDIFARLGPVLFQLLGSDQPVVICSHLPVLRIIYGYLMDLAPEQACQLDIPLNCAVRYA
ncbi:unnamed protein product [Chrysoparadoxa australica]